MDIFILNIENEVDVNKYLKFLNYLSIERKEKTVRYRKDKDKITSILSEILIRVILAEIKKVKNEKITFTYNEYGKPKLIGDNNFHFNISHSGKFIVIAIDSKSVGVDIEKFQDIDIQGIVEKFFTKKESEFILSKEKEIQIEEFYRLWTLKESYIKMVGKGLYIPINSFSFIKDKENRTTLGQPNIKKRKAWFRSYKIEKEYFLSVCFTGNWKETNISYINTDSLLSKFTYII
ncbi:MAG: 4'-phosphopantetheinyl transferase family protein [Clostridium sp.]